MPPLVVLAICMIYILIVNKIVLEEKKAFSFSKIVPFLWFVFISTRSLDQWINPTGIGEENFTLEEGNPLNRYTYFILLIFGVSILIKRHIKIDNYIRANRILFILYIYYLLSLIWSDFPFIAFKRWIKEIGNSIMILVILTDRSSISPIKELIWKFSIIFLPLSVVFIKFFPAYGRAYHIHSGEMFVTGVCTGRNQLGAMSLITGLYLIIEIINLHKDRVEIKNRLQFIFRLLTLIIGIILLFWADSTTSIICFVIGMFVYVYYRICHFDKNKFNLTYLPLFVISIFVIILIFFNRYIVSIIELTGSSLSFFDRTQNWPDFISMMGPNHLLGTGYDSYWLGSRFQYFANKFWWVPNQAHNGFIENYINTGYIGLSITILFLIDRFNQIMKNFNSQNKFALFQLAFFSLFLYYNITEAAMRGLHIMWFSFLLFTFTAPKEREL